MADRVKRKYRGRTYTVKGKSRKKNVTVRAYCRRQGGALWKRAIKSAQDWGF